VDPGRHPLTSLDDAGLRQPAIELLRRNDAGGWTKAGAGLYPHQWSWDSAFIAIGWAHADPLRALREQQRLFSGQWATGMVPHIVFGDDVPAESYFPDWRRWDTQSVTSAAPAGGPHTSGICQPPVHAIALQRIWQLAAAHADHDLRARTLDGLRDLYPRVLAWHRYLATRRDPEGSGLLAIYHPWEGADNSPRWDNALASVVIGDLPAFRRRDTDHVGDAAQRPTDEDYRRFLWLIELLKRYHYDDEIIQREHPFLVKDVFFTALFVAANTALLRLAELTGADAADAELISGWAAAGRRALARQWDAGLQLCVDYDLRARAAIRLRTFAGFAPLFAGGTDATMQAALLEQLDSPAFTGDPRLRFAVLLSTSPRETAFDPRNYWRGPAWPVLNWILWRALRLSGQDDRAGQLGREVLRQVVAGGFAEYFEPFTGEPLGATEQSWTAAVVLDMLDDGTSAAQPAW
jgi:glucosylglycerate hydrolase